jgi:trehalose 6-phosphate phosphatase
LTPEAAEKLKDFFGAFAGRPTPLLLLDYDGTLADFRVNRFTARPWAGVREQLAQIQRQGSTRIVVVTGRPAAEINTLLELDAPLEVWGLHGAERLYPDGRDELEEETPAVQEALEELRQKLKQNALGGLFEDKPNAAVIHWRGKTPRQAKLIERRARELFEPLAKLDGLSLLEFEAGIELRAGRDKGGAVEAILAQSDTDSPVTFVGDDVTDEAAFRTVNQASGPHLSVLMRRVWRETSAEVWLRPPEDLRAFLRMWLDAVRGAAAGKENRWTARSLRKAS